MIPPIRTKTTATTPETAMIPLIIPTMRSGRAFLVSPVSGHPDALRTSMGIFSLPHTSAYTGDTIFKNEKLKMASNKAINSLYSFVLM